MNKKILIFMSVGIFFTGVLLFTPSHLAWGQQVAQPQRKAVPQRSPPMVADPFEPCDIDNDGDCDIIDFNLVTRVIGQCIDTGNYNFKADADHDDCVTVADREILFPKGKEGLPPHLPAGSFKEGVPPQTAPSVSTVEPREPCDLNWDGQCDSKDIQLFRESLGHCGDDGHGIIPEADIDGDGCVTTEDQRLWFPKFQNK